MFLKLSYTSRNYNRAHGLTVDIIIVKSVTVILMLYQFSVIFKGCGPILLTELSQGSSLKDYLIEKWMTKLQAD